MIRFSIFRIPVSIHWLFFLLTAFLGGILRVQAPEDLRGVGVFMLAAFISILAHEFGHALTGRAFGAPKVAISLHGFGGAAYFWDHRFIKSKSIMMTAAGPACSLLLSGLSFAALIVVVMLEREEDLHYFANFLEIMTTINLVWGIFNLLPILPMDGGRIVQDLLGPGRLRITCIISFITLAIAGTALVMYTGSVYNFLIMFLFASYTLRAWKSVEG